MEWILLLIVLGWLFGDSGEGRNVETDQMDVLIGGGDG